MDPAQSLWIERTFVDQIVAAAQKTDGSVDVFLLLAGGGIGKTYAGRDAGHRLGSADGYRPHVEEGRWAWSGLLDLYDPDTNSNQGLERKLAEVFDPRGFDFDDYQLERQHYDLFFKGGIQGADLEEQRRKVEAAFAAGLRRAAAKRRLVIALDTIERLEAGSDPTKREIALAEDTASVAGWLAYQVTQVPNCVWLLMGRRGEQFRQALTQALAKRDADDPVQVRVHEIPIDQLDAEEVARFYAHRIRGYPKLAAILDPETRALLARRAGGNPLLLDLALQALLETQDPTALRQEMARDTGITAAGKELVKAYVNALDLDRELLLRYLGMARNGLWGELLQFLDPDRAAALTAKLHEMADLPFVKVRRIDAVSADGSSSTDRPTYFLHDEMYRICDDVLYSPKEARDFSRRLVDWHDRRIAGLRAAAYDGARESQQRQRFGQDLLVQSLFYRMRAEPAAGYRWYLQHEDQAIRSAQTGLDMRLREAFAVFLESARPRDQAPGPGNGLGSPVDRADIAASMPRLFDDFLLDSATLWIKRYTLRGKHDSALDIGSAMLPQVEALYRQDPEYYLLAYADFRLWYAQVMMYRGDIDEALKSYRQTIALLEQKYNREILEQLLAEPARAFEVWRASLVLGRLRNNLGYLYWMYEGRFRQAIAEFRKAIQFFQRGELPDEIANSQDNMGQVCARLGDEFAAIHLIKDAWLTRQDMRHAYREALSLVSWAIVLARLGHPELALKKANAALVHIRQADVARGRGLGLYARGIAYRALAESWREEGTPLEDALAYTSLAEADLKDAVEIFARLVKEPIREVRVLNELACLYRTRYLILALAGRPEGERDKAYYDGLRVFRDTIRRARECEFTIEELDSMQDQAVLYVRAGNYEEAGRYLTGVIEQIPLAYQIQQHTGLASVDPDDHVDLYYKLLGQVELLRGAMVFQKERRGRGGEATAATDDETLIHVARYYFRAVAYFNRYSPAYASQQANVRIHERFRVCTPAQIRLLRSKFSEWTGEYGLLPDLVRSLTEEVFGLFG